MFKKNELLDNFILCSYLVHRNLVNNFIMNSPVCFKILRVANNRNNL